MKKVFFLASAVAASMSMMAAVDFHYLPTAGDKMRQAPSSQQAIRWMLRQVRNLLRAPNLQFTMPTLLNTK